MRTEAPTVDVCEDDVLPVPERVAKLVSEKGSKNNLRDETRLQKNILTVLAAIPADNVLVSRIAEGLCLDAARWRAVRIWPEVRLGRTIRESDLIADALGANKIRIPKSR